MLMDQEERIDQAVAQPMTIASPDMVTMTTHILWERGWTVTADSILEMLEVGSHATCSPRAIEHVQSSATGPGAKEDWLKQFNPNSEWNRAHPHPWPIDPDTW